MQHWSPFRFSDSQTMQHIRAIAAGSTAIPSGTSHNTIPSCSETCEAFSGLSQPNRNVYKKHQKRTFLPQNMFSFLPWHSDPSSSIYSVYPRKQCFLRFCFISHKLNEYTLPIHLFSCTKLLCILVYFDDAGKKTLSDTAFSPYLLPIHSKRSYLQTTLDMWGSSQTKMQPAPGEMSGASLHHTTETSSMTRNLAVGGVAFVGERSATWVESVPQRVVE